jgi:DNA-binding transcriptional LysR family regulator
MIDFTLHELACFDAVASAGSFQAAADRLHRSHPTVYAAVKALEQRLGIALLDRSGYRVTLTEAGRAFHQRAQALLNEAKGLRSFSSQLAQGEESDLTVVIGDLCPLPEVLGLLQRFFEQCPHTRLHLHFEALSGPWERLLERQADLIVHHIDPSDTRLEAIGLFEVELVPVVAPGFLAFPIDPDITPERMRPYVQCIIRDTARGSNRDYFVLPGAHSWTVADQAMKRELIMRGMGWGHLPTYLIAEDLRQGRLLSIAGRHYRRSPLPIVAARLRERPHGPVAERLWRFIAEQAAQWSATEGEH